MQTPRLNYRKNLKVTGTMLGSVGETPFFTKNVSIKGFHACSTVAQCMEQGDIVFVRLPMLSLEGLASMVWKICDQDNVFHMGFKFLNMRGIDGNAYRYVETGMI